MPSPRKAVPNSPISAEALSDSARLVWEPNHPYKPADKDDFPAFSAWVLSNLAAIIEADLGPMLPEDPRLLRTRSRQAIAVLWWLNGALAMAKSYLSAATDRATYLENNDNAAAPEMRQRREFVVLREKRLYDVLVSARETIIASVNFSQTDLNSIREDIRLNGIEHGND